MTSFCLSDVMERAKYSTNTKYILLFIIVCLVISLALERIPDTYRKFMPPYKSMLMCSSQISDQTITPLDNTKHFMVSAFMDQRVKGFDIRIISIFRRDSIQPLHCLFCCVDHLSDTTPATVLVHSDHFDFPYGATDVMCQIPHNCNATHVTLMPHTMRSMNPMWLPLRNKKTHEKYTSFEFNFTVCISALFGGYNNVLQFAQTLEIYRLLGVGRVVVYNNSGGPELSRLLHSYSQEGLVELVQWPIHNYLNPSHGWRLSVHGGDLQYYGQLVALNECIYRSMERSRYVLLNDIDEIIMPYQHDNLTSLMDTLQPQHPNTGVFIIQALVYPKKTTKESNKGYVDAWRQVPGFNILQRIYWEDRNDKQYHRHKIFVEQTSVHYVLKLFGEKYKIPEQLCHIMHSVTKHLTERPLEELHLDKRLWDFKDRVIPRVTEMLRRAGLPSSEEEADE
ncbi:beta-1,4-galactosyltransferase galt-1-like isoform X2 [Betta splendens]|uniref:Glycosyltransferase family 92 protein n=1 Tax=Betta splendens TaxID=158456 RepID=A0A6P7LPZ1_BETSP|nr:beta-1,4-galactosyltransferase galt-1-like isoform X2 [Betta splendens]